MTIHEEVLKFLSAGGKKGGKAKGDRKRRSPEFYAELSKKGMEARAALPEEVKQEQKRKRSERMKRINAARKKKAKSLLQSK